MKTDTPTIGSAVNSHRLTKWGKSFFMKDEEFPTYCRSWIIEFIFYFAIAGLFNNNNKQAHHQVLLRSEVTSSHQETFRGIPQGIERDSNKPFARSSSMVGGFHRKSGRYRNACTRTHFSRCRFATSHESGIKEAQYYIHFQKDRNCDICLRNKVTRAPCKRRTGAAVLRAEKIGDLITADHKVLNDGGESRNNHRYAVVVQGFGNPMDSVLSVHNKNFSGDWQEFYESFLSRHWSKKYIPTVNSTPHTSFLMQCTRVDWCTSHCMAQVLVHALRLSPHSHSMCATGLFVLSLFPHLVLFRVFLPSLLLLPEPVPVPLPLPCGLPRGKIPLALRQMRSLALWPITRLSQVMSPTSLTISTTQRPLKSFSRSNPATRCPRTCMARNTVTRALFSSLFTHEREEPAGRGQAYHSFEESLLPSQSLSVCHVRTERPVHELSSLGSCSREKPCRDSENEQIRILFERRKEQILAEVRTEIQKHEFQADSDRRSIQELNEIIDSQRREIDHTFASDEQSRRDQQLLHEQLLEQNRDLSDAHMKSLNETEELKRFQELRIDEFSKRRLIEDRDTILELTAKIQELQNEVNRMNDSKDFKDVESVRSGQYHVTSQPALLPPFRDPGGMPSRSLGMPSRNDRPPSIWDTHGIIGKRFLQIQRGLLQHFYPQESNLWISNVSEHASPHVMSESQTPAQDQRCQSWPSARNSVVPSEGGCSKNYRADQQPLQISDPHFDKFTTSAAFACWTIRFKTEVRTCSQFVKEAMLWIKEVEMVESVDDLKSSRSIRGTQGQDFEVLNAKLASALNRIIHNTRFKKKISLEEMKAQKEDRFPSWKTDRLPDLWVLPGHWSQWFCGELCRPIYNCSSKWWYSGIRFKNRTIFKTMTQIPSDDILEGLYNLRIRESEKLRTVLEVYNMEIHQKKARPDYHSLKTMVKKKYRAEITNKEFWGQKRKLWDKRRG